MAYEIISQNNTTTTLSDGVNVIRVPARVVLATSTTYTVTKVNNNIATLEDGNGKVYKDIPCVAVLYGGSGGGGSDPHNLGWYADLAALQAAHATGEDGDFAILGSTDTVWVWDSGTSAWKDTDTKGQVTSVNNRTGAVTVSEVPDQTGQSGKFLTTDGTNPSWATVGGLPSQTGQSGKFLTTDGTDPSWATINALQNTATGTNSLTILGTASTGSGAVNLGKNSSANYTHAVAIGAYASAGSHGSVAIGGSASVSGLGGAIAIGRNARATASNAIQIAGNSSPSTYPTNSAANTVKIANANGNFEIMSADGTIPADRTSPVTSVATTTLTQTLAANYTYNCGEMTSLDISFPATPAVNYISQLNFSSGATPTSITAPNTIIWLGDDITGGVFVPVAGKRYCVMFYYDGTAIRGLVQGA